MLTFRIVSSEEFNTVKSGAKNLQFMYKTITPGSRCYLSADNKVGFSISPENELCHVFNLSPSIETLREGNLFAISCGASWIKMFDGPFAWLCKRLGYIETNRVPFDNSIAPKDWDYADGLPDVVTMIWKDRRV